MDLHDLLQKLTDYGYPGLFLALVLGIVGLPVPDETLLVFCGYLSAKGTLEVVLTGLTAIAGSVSGITISYWIGRSAGHSVVMRYGRYLHVTEARLDKVKDWFDRVGHWLLTIGYFVPGVRHFTALVAGMSEMPYPAFAAYAYPGAVIWVSTFVGLGYLLGDRWEELFDGIHRQVLIALAIIVVVGWIVWKVLLRRRDKASAAP